MTCAGPALRAGPPGSMGMQMCSLRSLPLNNLKCSCGDKTNRQNNSGTIKH